MANRISGIDSNDLTQPAQNFVDNENGEARSKGAFRSPSDLSQHFDSFVNAVDTGSEAKIRTLIDKLHRDMRREFAGADLKGGVDEKQLRERIQRLNGFIDKQRDVQKNLMAEMQIKQQLGKLSQQDAQLQMADIDRAKIRQQNAERILQTAIRQQEVNRRAANERKIAQTQYFNFEEQAQTRLAEIQKKREKTFAYHWGQNDLNPIKALQSYGMQKFRDARPMAFGGSPEAEAEGTAGMAGMAKGLGIAAAAVMLQKLVAKVWDTAKRGVKADIDIADASKGAAAPGQSSASFRAEIHRARSGYGISLEEEAAYAQAIRPLAGRIGQKGAYGELMRQSVMMDRATGMQLGTAGQFFGSMVRASSFSGTAADSSKFSLQIADAIGRGKMVGLEEEMLKSINSLVDLTRAQNVQGADPAHMADMIAGMGSLGAKNLRGEDAAQLIASMNEAIRNPKTPYGGFVGFQAIQATLKEKGITGMDSLTAQMYIRDQGLAAKVGDQNLGSSILRNTYRKISELQGDDYYKALVAQKNLGGTMSQHLEMLRNGNFEKVFGEENSVLSRYGAQNLNGKLFSNTGNFKFLETLSDELSKADKRSYNSEDEKLQDALNKAIGNVNLADEDKAELRKAYDNAGGSYQEKLKAVLEAGESVTQATPEDKMRDAWQRIDQNIQKWVESVLPIMQMLGRWFAGGQNKADTDYQKAVAAYKRNERATNAKATEGRVADADARDVGGNNYEAGNKLEQRYDELFKRASKIEHGDTDYRKYAGNVENQLKAGFINAGMFNFTSHRGKGSKYSTLDDFLGYAFRNSSDEGFKNQIKSLGIVDDKGNLKDSLSPIAAELANENSAKGKILRDVMAKSLPLQEAYYSKHFLDRAQKAISAAGDEFMDSRDAGLLSVVSDMTRVGVPQKTLNSILGEASGRATTEQQVKLIIERYVEWLKKGGGEHYQQHPEQADSLGKNMWKGYKEVELAQRKKNSEVQEAKVEPPATPSDKAQAAQQNQAPAGQVQVTNTVITQQNNGSQPVGSQTTTTTASLPRTGKQSVGKTINNTPQYPT